jgi:hypothetical protein
LEARCAFDILKEKAAMNFSISLKTMDGNELKEAVSGQDGNSTLRAVTLASVCATALVGNYPDEQKQLGDEKLKRFMLATKVHAGGEVVLTVEEIALIKQLLAKAYGALVCGQAWMLLDPACVKDDIKKS